MPQSKDQQPKARDSAGRDQAPASEQGLDSRLFSGPIFRAAFEQSSHFVGVLDTTGSLLAVNRAARRFAQTDQDILGSFFWDTPWWSHSPQEQERLKDAVARAARGEFIRYEATHLSPQGETLYVDFSLRPVRDQAGGIFLLIAEGRDITQRKKAEQELMSYRFRLEALVRERTAELARANQRLQEEVAERRQAQDTASDKEELLRATLEATADGILVIMADGRVALANARFREIWRVPPELLDQGQAQVLMDFMQEELEDPARLPAKLQEPDRDQGQYFGVLKLKNGRVLELFSNALVRDERFMGRVWSFRDVTQRKKAEEELRKLSRAVEQSPASVVITDLEGRIEYVNPKFTEVTGYSVAEALGQNPRILKSDMMPPEVYQELWQALTQGGQWRGELLNRRKDGSLYWESASISAIKGPDGKPTHYLAVKEDITERKRAEEELREAKQAAESASRAKSDFLANMSHEIRTPMNAIIGMTDLALTTELNREQREYLTTVKSSAESLLSLLDDILDYSKIEAGFLKLENKPFHLGELLESVLKTLALEAHQKGLEITGRLAPGVPAGIVGDPHRLRQVLVNLVGNAVKFTLQGEVAIEVEKEGEEGDALVLHFSVRDTGVGIPPDQLPLIFERFSQADTSSTRRFGGTGLGTAISKQLVEMMGGRIWAESRPGQGSVFHFTIQTRPAPQVECEVVPGSLRGVPVLVVDDNRTSRAILAETLAGWGMQVRSAAGGRRALEMLARAREEGEPIRLALVDVQMPEMDGFELARRLAPSQRPLFAFLTSSVVKEAPPPEAAGAPILAKPVRRAELLAILQALLEGRGDSLEAHGPREKIVTASRRLNILLAEDNHFNQMLVRALLGKRGHRVTVVGDGRAAVEAFSQGGYDLILMDVQMPEMDGLQATRAIRRQEQASGGHIPIVAMTAHAMDSDRQRCQEAGMDAYIVKPVQREELFTVLENLAADTSDLCSVPSGSPSPPPPEIWDRQELLDRVGEDQALVDELLKIFRESLPQWLEQIQRALQAGEGKELAEAAHALKGASANISAREIFRLALDLEQLGRRGDLATAPEVYQRLQEAVDRFLELLGR